MNQQLQARPPGFKQKVRQDVILQIGRLPRNALRMSYIAEQRSETAGHGLDDRKAAPFVPRRTQKNIGSRVCHGHGVIGKVRD
jgi:hypothetical protein